MKFYFECESKEGNRSKRYVSENQDAFSCKINNDFCCICLADGAGSKRFSAFGARCLVDDISKYLINNAYRLIDISVTDIRRMLAQQIQESLARAAKLKNTATSELASTLICVLTDGKQYLTVHLGDGVVIAERGGSLNVLSFPENGSNRFSTALSNMVFAGNHLRITEGSCDQISSIWVMTDGAMNEVFQDNYWLNGERLSMPMIREKLSAGHSDDATYGCLKWENKNGELYHE